MSPSSEFNAGFDWKICLLKKYFNCCRIVWTLMIYYSLNLFKYYWIFYLEYIFLTLKIFFEILSFHKYRGELKIFGTLAISFFNKISIWKDKKILSYFPVIAFRGIENGFDDGVSKNHHILVFLEEDEPLYFERVYPCTSQLTTLWSSNTTYFAIFDCDTNLAA